MKPGSATGIGGDGDEHRFEAGLLVAEVLQTSGQFAGERAQRGRGEVEAQEFDLADPADGNFGVADAGVELVEAVVELLSVGRCRGVSSI